MGPIRKPRVLPGVTREDSDDELGYEDHPWEWIYEDGDDVEEGSPVRAGQKRKRSARASREIVGARMGSFECRVGDCVLLKAEGNNAAWVGLICDFKEDDEGEPVGNFMWFSSEKEIRNKDKKRKDFYWVSGSPGGRQDSACLLTINLRMSSTLLRHGMTTP
jgi:origin recognition complex subunit 1